MKFIEDTYVKGDPLENHALYCHHHKIRIIFTTNTTNAAQNKLVLCSSVGVSVGGALS